MAIATLSPETIATLWHMFKSDRCPVCTRRKEKKHCFCRSCYFALPAELRSPLWYSALEGDAFFEAYQQAKTKLFQMGMGKTA